MTRNDIVKITVFATVLALVLGLAFAGEKFEDKFARTESLDRDGRVMITNVSGLVDIKAWDQAQVKIEAVKTADASSLDKAKENAALVTIEVTKTGSILKIETKYPSGRSRNLNVKVDYKIWVPDKAAVKARNTSGSLTVEGVGGEFEADVTSGNVTLSKISGSVDCRTVSGRIDIQDVTGDVAAKTVSGNIAASRIKGSVEGETTSGRIEFREVSEAKTVRAKVLSGNISYDGQVAAGAKFNLETLSGGVELTLPANAAFEVNAETFSGRVTTDFPITMSGSVSPREVRGVVNNGGASLRLKTFSGSIHIKKK